MPPREPATARAASNAASTVSVRRTCRDASPQGKSLRKWAPRLSRRSQRGDGNQHCDQRRIRGSAGRTGQRQQRFDGQPSSVWSRTTPAARDRIGRTAPDPQRREYPRRSAAGPVPSGAAATLSATDPAPTTASNSELLARRLAPCSPVPATSPQAHKPGACCVRANPPQRRPYGNGRPDEPGSAGSQDLFRPSRRQRR